MEAVTAPPEGEAALRVARRTADAQGEGRAPAR